MTSRDSQNSRPPAGRQPGVEDAEREQDERHGERERGQCGEQRQQRGQDRAVQPDRARPGRPQREHDEAGSISQRRAALSPDRAGGGDDLLAALGVAGDQRRGGPPSLSSRSSSTQPALSSRSSAASTSCAPTRPPGATARRTRCSGSASG